jgi:hypothetical protein
MIRFATTAILMLALTASSALADAPQLQRAAGPTRSIEHATPQSAKARHAVSQFVMIDEPRDTAPFLHVSRFVMIDESRNVAPFNLSR